MRFLGSSSFLLALPLGVALLCPSFAQPLPPDSAALQQAVNLRQAGRLPEAAATLRHALESASEPSARLPLLEELAEIQQQHGDLLAAAGHFEDCLEILARDPKANETRISALHTHLAPLLLRLNQPFRSLSHLQAAAAQPPGPSLSSLLPVADALALRFEANSDNEHLVDALRLAVALREITPGHDKQHLARDLIRLADIFESDQRIDEADHFRARAAAASVDHLREHIDAITESVNPAWIIAAAAAAVALLLLLAYYLGPRRRRAAAREVTPPAPAPAPEHPPA